MDSWSCPTVSISTTSVAGCPISMFLVGTAYRKPWTVPGLLLFCQLEVALAGVVVPGTAHRRAGKRTVDNIVNRRTATWVFGFGFQVNLVPRCSVGALCDGNVIALRRNRMNGSRDSTCVQLQIDADLIAVTGIWTPVARPGSAQRISRSSTFLLREDRKCDSDTGQ